jgi:hypothetical protein
MVCTLERQSLRRRPVVEMGKSLLARGFRASCARGLRRANLYARTINLYARGGRSPRARADLYAV